MSTIARSLLPGTLALWLLATLSSSAQEPGFVPLLDRAHTAAWKQSGRGGFNFRDGIATSWFPNEKGGRAFGVYWYSARTFSDFVLKLEYKGESTIFNSGVRIRFPDPGNEPITATNQGYEIAIETYPPQIRGSYPTGSIYGFQKPSANAQREKDWNEFEITAVGQKFTVKLNGRVVNEFTGSRLLSGYVGLENHRIGPVQFRNVRIKDLSAAPAAPPVAPAASPTSIQTEAGQPRILVLKDQGLNAMEWALAPLDDSLPPDIRQNVALLREDLLDEVKKAPKASADAYALGSQFCEKLLLALEERHQTRAKAGYTAAQADADVRVSSQSLEARRNSQMSWPQFSREQSQRAELQRRERSGADLKKERSDLEWTTRTEGLRKHLEDLYRQFREALR